MPPSKLSAQQIAERVADVVIDIPAGRVMTYSDIGALVGATPRQVGRIMAGGGAGVIPDDEFPWWRVTNVQGKLPPHLHDEALARYLDEETPVKDGHADIRRARFRPE